MTGISAQFPANDVTRVRERRRRAARKFRPDSVRLLLVAEAPPTAPDRYFYFEKVAAHDSLFLHVASEILKVDARRDQKPQLLAALRDRGVFLIDLLPDPLGTVPLAAGVPRLVRRAHQLAPGKVILIKATVYDTAFAPLRDAGLPVVDVRVPFPGSGQQRRFREAFGRALRSPAISAS